MSFFNNNNFEMLNGGFGFVHEKFNAFRIGIFSSEDIRNNSNGQVINGETINYRTGLPESGGLFCAKIFGSVKNYECLCGKYRGIRYTGIICDRCKVEVTPQRVRRKRMGHIELASPVAHIWFLRSLPSRICQILDMTMKNVEKILYFESYLVLDPGLTQFTLHQVITEKQYNEAFEEYGFGAFEADMGADAIKKMLASLNLSELSKDLRSKLSSDALSEMKRKKFVKRLRLIEEFMYSGNKPEYMIFDVIPVMPPDLRPLVTLEGGRFASSDLNALYRAVINRNNRLRNLIVLQAPRIVINNEKRMLQESVDALFDNSRKIKMMRGANKRPYKSISDMLKGKQGRFRQNLLGKRVDYSARSVIVVGPKLKLNQCGLPKKIALELFKPFIYSKLEMYGIASTLKTASRMVQNEKPEVWDILEEVIRHHPVLLNRAPTLHRMSIQAFDPVLIEGKAIQVHPLVCSAFNADFDGDQMAVHLPLSMEAQIEARVLMMSDRNILNPANGKPTIVPSKDIVLGIYYLTIADNELSNETAVDEGMLCFANINEVKHALFAKYIKMHTNIKCRIDDFDVVTGSFVACIVKTTAGRLIFMEILPKNISFSEVNKKLTVKEVTDLVSLIYKRCGRRETVEFCDRLMGLGFKYATISGISFGKNDMVIPKTKAKHVALAKEKVSEYEEQYQEGLITKNEKYNKVVDIWQQCTEQVSVDMIAAISSDSKVENMNNIFMMADSGARGSPAQIKQLAGMRGLMAKPSGEIMDTPIISNLREGQSVMEYFISTHGARKGLADTALKTANSGYLTRRLVDVAQDLLIVEDDCGTKEGLVVRAVLEGANVVQTLSEIAVGRVTSVDIVNISTGEMLVKSGDVITEESMLQIENCNIDALKIRSVLTCDSEKGVCSKCYGIDLSNGRMVCTGEAVGIIAAQSVGEPGTQLTMRTFHVGGAATKRIEVSGLNAFCSGKVKLIKTNVIKDRNGVNIVLSRSSEIIVIDKAGVEQNQGRLPYGTKLHVLDGDEVTVGAKLAEWEPYNTPIVSEVSGRISYVDLVEGVSVNEVMDELTGITNKVIVDWKQNDQSLGSFRPRIEILDENRKIKLLPSGTHAVYACPVGAVLAVDNEVDICAGDTIAKIPKGSSTNRDITGGLPKVAELFEARRPKDYSFISDIDGIVRFSKDSYKSKRKIVVESEDGLSSFEYSIPKGKHITVSEGDFIKKGDLLMDGEQDPHDILKVMGPIAFADYMINSIQHVYRLQGVKISNKHFEVILRKMLQKVEIVDPAGETYLAGEYIDKRYINRLNARLKDEGKSPVIVKDLLLGITKVSLKTESFISAASFQETTKVLTEAAVSGKIDMLFGLKENVIVGRLPPVGTGFHMYHLMKEGKNAKKREIEKKNNNENIISDNNFDVDIEL